MLCKPFIAQTVNYANNEGVLWCVLTNGLNYRVYKSNEPVDMARKLLYEVNLQDAANEHDRPTVLRSLSTLSRMSAETGELDAWGEEVFTDVRIRTALAGLGRKPSPGFIRAVAARIEGRAIKPQHLKAGLRRILSQSAAGAGPAPVVGVAPKKGKVSKRTNGQPRTSDLEHHTAGKPQAIVDLYGRLDNLATGLGPDVSRRPVKWYIGYFAGKKSFCTVNLQKAKVVVHLSLNASEAKPWDDEAMRDVAHVGHQGLGNTEFILRSPDQISQLETLMRQSYLLNRRS